MHATANNMPAKPEKPKVVHHLEAFFQPMTTTNEPEANVIYGNFQLYALSHIPFNFQCLAEMVLDRLQKASSVDLVTDIDID